MRGLQISFQSVVPSRFSTSSPRLSATAEADRLFWFPRSHIHLQNQGPKRASTRGKRLSLVEGVDSSFRSERGRDQRRGASKGTTTTTSSLLLHLLLPLSIDGVKVSSRPSSSMLPLQPSTVADLFTFPTRVSVSSTSYHLGSSTVLWTDQEQEELAQHLANRSSPYTRVDFTSFADKVWLPLRPAESQETDEAAHLSRLLACSIIERLKRTGGDIEVDASSSTGGSLLFKELSTWRRRLRRSGEYDFLYE